MQRPLWVTGPLVPNLQMVRMVEAAGFPAGQVSGLQKLLEVERVTAERGKG